MLEIDREIDGTPDYELDRPRTARLRYSMTWPRREASGVVLVIPGFGADVDAAYSRSLRRHIVETTGMGAVSVRYHAIEARPSNGASVEIPQHEQTYLKGVLAEHGMPAKGSSLQQLIAAAGALVPGVPVRGAFVPGRGEYQNFGIMQALDHLCVIGDLLENPPSPFDRRRIVALGSSHGGYIAHLIAKLAPSTLAAVIENSAYCQPPMNYLGIGGEPEVIADLGGVRLHGNVRSAWTMSDREDPAFYDRDRDLIRDLRYLPHALTARAAASDAGVQYLMVHSEVDEVSSPEVKRRQHQVLLHAGFAAELQMVGQKDLDGRLFKSLDHGLDCSLKALFEREIGRVNSRQTAPDATLGSAIEYDCVDRGYRFVHRASAPYVSAETYDLFPVNNAPDKKDGRLHRQAA